MAAQASANVNSQVDNCIPNIVSNLKKMCIKKGESVNNRIPDRCKEKHVIEKVAKKSVEDDKVVKKDKKNLALAVPKIKLGSEHLQMMPMEEYGVPESMSDIEKNENSSSNTSAKIQHLVELKPLCRKNKTDYISTYKSMIYLEEAAQSVFMSQFDTKNIKLLFCATIRTKFPFCTFRIKRDSRVFAMTEAIQESILDHFTLKSVRNSQISISGRIKGMNREYIFVEIGSDEGLNGCQSLLKRYGDKWYDISFHINRTPFQLQHYALKCMNDDLFDALINNPNFDNAIVKNDCNSSIEHNYDFSGNLALNLNEEQKEAVMSIINAENIPLPYLLFGPAGTGKTSTLVAAIEEIVRSTNKAVLVCANSNSACDEITERLVKVLHFGEMFRMYARSFDKRQISENIMPICNWIKGKFHLPSLEVLYKFRVVVCTLSTTGCIVRAARNPRFGYRKNPYFGCHHFSHIFVDECASTHETVSMIPITGLCFSQGKITSSIVLAGDPKQLDAVTKSKNAIKLGFKTSYMEQLFEKPLYKRDPITAKYNPKYITQLVKNYRSHPAILSIPNALFYDNKLEAKASEDQTNWFIGSKMLPSSQFPIIFKSVQGFCKRSQKDFSLFNQKEVCVVIEYIKKLLKNDGKIKQLVTQSHIGVVTPYKLQCKKITRACHQNNFNDITIGTAEVFQGQEKPIMIVSTVRTGGLLGFVNDPRRLNVVITRAKCLLIIVGDHNTLRANSNWNALIDNCLRNGALI